ncbi:MAG: hypothetical protein JWP59_2547 [Massilia sp.]|jgi:hypothetical protein|nr:hypothetical protein [Massilia sp.]
MLMPNWPALLLTPSIALANASVAYALVTPACASQSTSTLHALCAASLVACVVVTVPVARRLRRATPARRHFVDQLASMAGALSALVVLVEWLAVLMVSPCAA